MIKESEIVIFEKQWRCELPSDFRNYILTDSYPNALTPKYWFDAFPYDMPGIIPFEREPEYISNDWLILPCPITADMNLNNDWLKLFSKDTIDPFQGCISIAFHGCTFYDLLIVTGKDRGSIMSMDGDYGPPKFIAQNFKDYCKIDFKK